MGTAFPELNNQKELIHKVITEEENSFFRTLELGIKRIENLIKTAKENNLVVGSQSRILYADSDGRIEIALAFNKAIA